MGFLILVCIIGAEKAKALDLSWRKFFADPSCWWDRRYNKRKRSSPDFVHCITREALFADSWLNPPWVEAQLLALENQRGNFPARAKYASGRHSNCIAFNRDFNNETSFGGLRRLCGRGELEKAISVARMMQQQGMDISNNAFFYVLRGCMYNGVVAAGMKVFDLIVRAGLESNTYLGSQAIEMFTAFRSLSEANDVFRRLHNPNVFCWSAIIMANVKLGNVENAIFLYDKMMLSSLQADGHTFVAVIKACTNALAIAKGKAIHACIHCYGLHHDSVLGNALVNMYARFGHLSGAHLIFENLPQRDLVAWTSMISGYIQKGCSQAALHLVFRMYSEGIKPDDSMSACILNACAHSASAECGDLIYAQLLGDNLELGSFAASAVMDLYCKFGRLDDASKVFDSVFDRCTVGVWNTMIAGYAMHGHAHKAMALLHCMQTKGLKPDKVTYVNVLCMESTKVDSVKVREMNDFIAKNGFELDTVAGSALLHLHAKTQGFLEDACRLFNNVQEKDVVSWSTMVTCYVRHGYNDEALGLFQRMQQDGVLPNAVTFLASLKACTNVVALQQGNLVHHTVVEYNYESDLFVGSMLIDMYNKCRSLQDSYAVFNKMTIRDSVTWNTIIEGFSYSNFINESLQYLNNMQSQGLKPNQSTFACILNACSSIGLESTPQTFQLFQTHGGLTMKIHNLLVDGFGRSGHLEESDDLLHVIPYSDNKVRWRSLLSYCRTYKNLSLAKQYFWISGPDRDGSLVGSSILC
ncbi:hypothetical protein KP509_18G057200 [Ceratopteris richardii]|uniref:Pentatricopeptide repeat-containing protein n=1 Tax=Ceratopteris richardii TaxID=49495 RepID=A0A8T2SRT3_CERRI|nr:hypothetical protein KP509_18G057200 [Ceratopteris richardii]